MNEMSLHQRKKANYFLKPKTIDPHSRIRCIHLHVQYIRINAINLIARNLAVKKMEVISYAAKKPFEAVWVIHQRFTLPKKEPLFWMNKISFTKAKLTLRVIYSSFAFPQLKKSSFLTCQHGKFIFCCFVWWRKRNKINNFLFLNCGRIHSTSYKKGSQLWPFFSQSQLATYQ